MTGADVWPAFLAGRLRDIRAYCEVDVLNTYLVYLSFEHMRGNLQPSRLTEEQLRLRTWLAEQQRPHFDEFLAAWPDKA